MIVVESLALGVFSTLAGIGIGVGLNYLFLAGAGHGCISYARISADDVCPSVGVGGCAGCSGRFVSGVARGRVEAGGSASL